MTATAPRPGSIINVRTSPPPSGVPTSTDAWYIVGTTDKGPLTPVWCYTLQDFINTFGGRQTYSVLYDAVENFFREGGVRICVRRVVGPTPVVATVNLLDGSAGISLTVKGKGPSASDNNLRIGVTNNTTTFFVTVSDISLPVGQQLLETSPVFSTQDEATVWSAASAYVNITKGGSILLPATIAAAALTTGTDDRANIVDAQWATALAQFPKDIGAGQLSAPGRTSTVGHAQVLLRAWLDNRFGLLDAPDTPTIATVTSAGTAQRGTNDDYGAMFAPWVNIPAITQGANLRVVPPCSTVAGIIARNEAQGMSPNRPSAAAGEGTLRYGVGLSQPSYDNGTGVDVTRDAMYSSSVNLLVSRYGTLQVFGWRTMVSETGAKQAWLNAGNARFRMALTAEFLKVAEGYILDEIDGRGLLFRQFQGDLEGVLLRYYTAGSLYGPTPESAYRVDTGPTVNTPTTIADGQIKAAVGVRMSPAGELVGIDVTKYPVTQSL